MQTGGHASRLQNNYVVFTRETSLPKVIWEEGTVAHVRRKVPTGYNGAPQIRTQKYPFQWTDPHYTTLGY